MRCIGRSPARAGRVPTVAVGVRVLAGIFSFQVRVVCGAPREPLRVLGFVRCIGRSPARAGRVPTVAGLRVLAGIFSFRVRVVCGAPRGPLRVLVFVRCIGRSPARVSEILFDALPSAHYNSGMKKVLDTQNAASTISTKNKEQRTKNKGGIASFLNTINSIYQFSHKSLYWYDFSRNDIGFLYQFWRRKQYG